MHLRKFWSCLQKAHSPSETVLENNYLLREYDILRRSAIQCAWCHCLAIKIYVMEQDSDLENVLNCMYYRASVFWPFDHGPSVHKNQNQMNNWRETEHVCVVSCTRFPLSRSWPWHRKEQGLSDFVSSQVISLLANSLSKSVWIDRFA